MVLQNILQQAVVFQKCDQNIKYELIEYSTEGISLTNASTFAEYSAGGNCLVKCAKTIAHKFAECSAVGYVVLFNIVIFFVVKLY